jgi:hypothetical protein
MSRQFSFFLTEGDVLDLERTLRAELRFLVTCYESSSSRPVWSERLDPASLQCSSRTLVLAPPEYAGQVLLKQLKTRPDAFYVDSLRSPVVESTFCARSNNVLRAGRFYYHEGYYEEGGAWVQKPAPFRKWAEKLFEVVKRELTRDLTLGGAYVGRDAQAWANDPEHSLKLI